MKAIFANIINYAIYDFCVHKESREEIREFFKSSWGHEICEIFNIDADKTLADLESGKLKVDKNQWRNYV